MTKPVIGFIGLGLMGGNMVATIKMAKYYEMGSGDVLVTVGTDSMEMYESRLVELREERGEFTSLDAAAAFSRYMLGAGIDYVHELSYYDRKRIHNLKYYTWVEQQGKTYEEILGEKLAIADRVLYRRGNFMGTWDQVLCNALRDEYGADVALSAGVRWGTSTLEGDWITMEDVMTQCSMTYGETYMNEMKGQDLMNVLEQVADNLFDPDPYLQSGGDMVRVGGLEPGFETGKRLLQFPVLLIEDFD